MGLSYRAENILIILGWVVLCVPFFIFLFSFFEGKILERDFKAGVIHVRHVDAESARKLIDHKHVNLVSQYDHPHHIHDVFVFEVAK